MNFRLPANIRTLSPRPILFVIGEHAHSRYFSEDAYELAGAAKVLLSFRTPFTSASMTRPT
jgi:fermentation-respiration switch protein FrsA (DUF1100 family)